ncbi:hypothetical protein QBC46DRAFT_458223 [Diplogelasinospora grovesii]|uniref:Transcription initiation factor TFIID subunit 2 n=1 Tax=Diplogelasinospora grovesii TaxID=303347 RepID=A0AAN6N986_9PEZI|nr:hypothetical protein QBC46DRAFT_458223 [Diplogelasinospora grovesii]
MSGALEAEVAVEPVVKLDYRASCEPFVILKQEVELEVNFREKSISGVSTIWLFQMVPDLDEISLDARQCEIDLDNITVDGVKTTASFSDPYDLLAAPRQWQLGATQHHVMSNRMWPLTPDRRPDVPISEREKQGLGCVPADRALKVSLRPEVDGLAKSEDARRTLLKIKTAKSAAADGPDANDEKSGTKISIPFRSKNIRDGLHFVGVDEGDSRYPHVYTRHSIEPGTASCIFPCVDDPGSRHPWKIMITCPRTLGNALEQPLATQQATATTLAPLNGNRKRKNTDAPPTQPPQPPQQPQVALVEEDKLMEMTVVCSGNLSGEQIDSKDGRKKIMTFEVAHSAAQHIAFAIGPFEHIDLSSEFRTEESDEKLGVNAAKIHAYCLPGRQDEVLNTCAPIVAAADYFAPEFGRYPFESYKMCFVEDMLPDTAAATSMSLCSTRLLYPEDVFDPEIEVTRKLYLGVHIVPNQRSDSWLIVGIQWFMTDLFMKILCGNNWYKFHLKTMSDKLIEADVHRPALHDLDFELDFMALKAPLRMSKYPGSTGVARVVSQIVSAANISNLDPLTTSLSAEEFRRAPQAFWKQWVFGAGCPRLKNLNVDISITQSINKDEFWREYQEEIHNVYAGEVPKIFTGPFTVRIHEADEIREDDRQGTTWQIPYNTKYKRLKPTANLAADKQHDIQDDDVVYFNMLGDVLMTPKDIQNWGLQDWSDKVQVAMDQESYEWIRFDCNFEWICETNTDMPGYMYLAQLQQDRDVVAHQDAMLFFQRGKRHGVAATIETRTIMDRRYYHGIRTMAVEDLPKQADPDLNYIGLAQLILCFRHFFCDRMVGKNGIVTYPPAPNDFHDKAQYAVQSALPGAIARTRENGRCSRHGRTFLLDLLLFNDNSDNDYSDHFYIAKLLEALTTSLIPEKQETDGDLISSLSRSEDDDDLEFKRFIEKTIEEIDKYRRMDEWTLTYHNVWTTTALECKMRLMKARVIKPAPLEFVQYLQDDNIDLVRIKAFECLVEIGMIAKAPILKLLLSYMSTDKSPFVRDRLFKIFVRGIAAVAVGETKAAQQEQPQAAVDDSGLIIEAGEAEIQQRKLDAVRKEDINHALHALKEELKGNVDMQIAIWKAVESPIIGLKEKRQLLELCSAMFEPDDSLLLTFNYPKYWECEKEVSANAKPAGAEPRSHSKKSCIVRFTSHYRTNPRSEKVTEQPPAPTIPVTIPAPPEVVVRPPEPKKIKLSSRPSFGPSVTLSTPAAPPNPPAAPVRKDSISVTIPPRPPVAALPAPPTPAVATDSIAVQPIARVPTPKASSPPPRAATPSIPSHLQHSNGNAIKLGAAVDKRPKPPKKRKSDEADDRDRDRDRSHDHRPKKIKTENGGGSTANGLGVVNGTSHGRPSKIVTVRFTRWHKLPEKTRYLVKQHTKQRTASPAVGSSIVATPASSKSRPPSYLSDARSDARSSPGLARASPAPGSIKLSNSRPPERDRERDRDRDRGRDSGGGIVKQRKPLPGAGDRKPLPGPGERERKPLPGSVPHPRASPAPATTTTANGSNGTSAAPTPSAPPRKVIKLKVKPLGQNSPRGP